MVSYNLGADGGNNSIKLYLEGGKKFSYTNVLVPKKLHYKKNDKFEKTPLLHKLHMEVTLDKGNQNVKKEFLFGELAKQYITPASGNRAYMGKSKDVNLAMGMITSIAFSIFVDNYKKGKNLIKEENSTFSFSINIGTGLPYEESNREGAIEAYRKNLEGTHIIKFLHPDFKGLTIELTVNIAMTHFVEGEEPLTLMLNKLPEELEELLGGIYVSADGGAYTFDVTGAEFVKVFEDDGIMIDEDNYTIEPQTKTQYSFAKDRGIGHVFQEIIDEIQAKHDDKLDRVLDRKDIEDALKNTLNGKTGWIMPEKIYIFDLLEERVEIYAEEIAKQFVSFYNNANAKSRIKKIYLSGGASKIDVFVNTFRKILTDNGYSNDVIVRLTKDPDPIYANAEGYYYALMEELEMLREEGAEII